MAAVRGLCDGPPVCRPHSETAVGRALGRAAVGGRPRAGAVRGAWRPAARSGGGRRAAPLQCGDPLAVPASPRPCVPTQLPLASGTAHLQVRGLGWGLPRDLALPGAGSRRELGDSRGHEGFGERQDGPQGHPGGGGGLLVSEVEPGPCASAQDRVRRVLSPPESGGILHPPRSGAPSTHHELGASPIAHPVGPGPGGRVTGLGAGRIPILQKLGVPHWHGVLSNPEASRLGDSNPCGLGR